MKLVLKETLNPRKKMVAGAVFDLPPASVRLMSEKLGRTDWYENLDRVQQENNRRAMRRQSPGRPRKGSEEE